MRIGNLSRAGRPAGGHSGRLARILSLAAMGAALLAAWQFLPFPGAPDPSGRTSTAALSQAVPAVRSTAPAASAEPQAKRQQAATPPASAPAAPAPRVVYAGPSVTSSAAPPSRPSAAPEPAPALPAAAEPARSVAAPAVAPAPNPTPPPPRTTVSAAAPAPVPADTAPSTQAASRIDLNTASVEELNAIPGAGLIGRAIVRGRPYASPEDLLTKRVLNRATYDRIKDQIAVQ